MNTDPNEHENEQERLMQQATQAAFAQARDHLGELSEKTAEAEAAVEEVSTVDFPARRSRMRRACGAVVTCGIMIFLAALVAVLAVQELAVDLSRGFAGDGPGQGRVLVITTLVLGACFVGGLLIAKVKTDYSRELAALKQCAPSIRSVYLRRIAAKAISKVLYLALLGTVYFHFHARHEAAAAFLERVAGAPMTAAPNPGSGLVARRFEPAEPAKALRFRGLGSRDGLYVLDLFIHGLVLFGLPGVGLAGLKWRLAFASPGWRRRKLARLRRELSAGAGLIYGNLVAQPQLIDSMTEDEKRLINRVFGRTVVQLASGDTQPAESAVHSEEPANPAHASDLSPF